MRLLLLLSLLWFFYLFILSMHRYAFQVHDGWKHNGRNWIVCFRVDFRFPFLWCLCDKFTPYFCSMCRCVYLCLVFFCVIAFWSMLSFCLPTKQCTNQSKNGCIRKKAKPLFWSLFGGFIDSFWLNVLYGWFHACVRGRLCDCVQFG